MFLDKVKVFSCFIKIYKNLKIMLENLKQFEIEKKQLIHVYGGSLVVNSDDNDDNIVDGTQHVKNKK